MRIKRVHIKNFRCLGDVEVKFDQITTFIGPNGAGKSTVLRALDWFFNGTKGAELTDDDYTFGSDSKVISVEIEFCDLSAGDRAQLGSYVTDDSDRFIAWKHRMEDGTERMTSNARSFPTFDEIRSASSAAERKSAYKTLRETRPELDLPPAATDVTLKDAMRTWELEHPGQLEESKQQITNFFGFNSQAKMAGVFDFVLVTADLRASEEILDSKATIIGRILERAVKRDGVDVEIEALTTELQSRQQKIYDEHFGEQLADMSHELTDAVSQYASGRSVKVQTDDIQLKPARTQFSVSVLDQVVETPISRQGHGFQRALLISALQVLAKRGSAGQNNGTICLAIEEPELFQHPVQARAFAAVLRQLAENPAQSVQISYATHSPYFLSAGHFDEVRRITRPRSSDPGKAPPVSVRSTTVASVKSLLTGYVDPALVDRQMDNICLDRLPEALFATAVVLTEGTTDRAVLEGATERLNTSPLAVSGIVVADVGGKNQFFLPLVVLSELGIACYAIFDGDSGCMDRMRSKGRKDHDIRNVENKHKDLNRTILRFLGQPELDWPPTSITPRYAILNDRLETTLASEWPAWIDEAERLAAAGLGDTQKNALVYRYAARGAATEPPTFFVDLLAKARGLADVSSRASSGARTAAMATQPLPTPKPQGDTVVA